MTSFGFLIKSAADLLSRSPGVTANDVEEITREAAREGIAGLNGEQADFVGEAIAYMIMQELRIRKMEADISHLKGRYGS